LIAVGVELAIANEDLANARKYDAFHRKPRDQRVATPRFGEKEPWEDRALPFIWASSARAVSLTRSG
jgi:hypothetical protein